MFHCVATLRLRRGQITLQGLIEVQGEDDPGPFTVAITGGTGKYIGAGGKAVVREVGHEDIYKLRFTPARSTTGSRRGASSRGRPPAAPARSSSASLGVMSHLEESV